MARYRVMQLPARLAGESLSEVASHIVISEQSTTDILGQEHERRNPILAAFCPTKDLAEQVKAGLNNKPATPAASIRKEVSTPNFQSTLEDLLTSDSALLLQFELLVVRARKRQEANK